MTGPRASSSVSKPTIPFNHTQFSGIDTTARFDAAGNQTNARFGQYTAAINRERFSLA